MRKRKPVQISAVGSDPESVGSIWDRSASAQANARWRATQPPETDAHDARGFAPCRVCGGPVGMGGRYFGPWREHTQCRTVAAYPPSRLVEAARVRLGIEMTLAEAEQIDLKVSVFSDVHHEPTYARGERSAAWGHVDATALSRAVKAVDQPEPTRCTSGPCAVCGVALAIEWEDHEHRWADGSPAPLCGHCAEVYVRRGSPSPTYWEDQREFISEALTGAPTMMGYGVPAGVVAYAETETLTTGQAWSHLPPMAVEEYRWEVWGRFGGRHCPPEHRAEAVRRAEAREVAKADRIAAEAVERAARQDVHGFGV